MKKNDKMIRCDYDSYNLIKLKKKKMEETAKYLTNKNINIPLKNVIKVLASKPIYLDDNNLLDLAKEKNNKKRKWY